MIGERIKNLRKKLNYTQVDFCNLTGIKPATLSDYESRGKVPSEVIETIIEKTSVNAGWLMTGRGDIFGGVESSGDNSTDGVERVDILDMKASAGPGIENGHIEIIGNFHIDRRFLAGYKAEDVKAIFVHGDSMQPTLYDGDVIMFVPNVKKGNGVYVIEVFGEMRCKRLEFRLDGSVMVLSDNPRYSPESFKPEDETVRICGKVVAHFHTGIY